jgi:UDP-N-acetylmuramoyl-L-alanyl-D-glutamate--2,6-diaminopimelate ligase
LKALKDIVEGAGVVNISGNPDLAIESIEFDSTKCKPGSLFIAVKGTRADGHDYIGQAIENGAVAVAGERTIPGREMPATFIRVENSARALGIMASNFFDGPSSKLRLVGVTGTNGKTTIVNLLYNMVSKMGYKAGLLSTIENKIDDQVIGATHTTPDPIQINRLMQRMVNEGCTHCFMEVSSHAIHQQRIAGLEFNGAIFTNLTQDHLDYHVTFDDYLKAKKLFFDDLPSGAFALTNLDDRNGQVMVQNTKAAIKTYALKKPADFKGKIIENQFGGLQLNIDGQDLWCKLVGQFNAYNVLAVYGACILLGEDKNTVLTGLSALDTVEGRFDYIRGKGNITGIVDYAHTPDALKNVLETIHAIRTRNETLITVVGAGGDRDRGKRPAMGKIAATLSDRVIITSDNPRSEDPEEIIRQIRSGLDPSHSARTIIISDRREAIKTACMLAKPNDIILVAGKGHEKYQEIRGIRYPFDDKEILNEYLMLKPLEN